MEEAPGKERGFQTPPQQRWQLNKSPLDLWAQQIVPGSCWEKINMENHNVISKSRFSEPDHILSIC